MEKRLLISFVLSFLILFIWSAMNPPSKDKPAAGGATFEDRKSETVVSKEDTTPSPEPSLPPELLAQEELVVLENEVLRVEVSTIGGVIKQVYLKEYNATLPVADVGGVAGYSDKMFRAVRVPDGVVLLCQDGEGTLKKSFKLSKQSYTIAFNVQSDGEMSKMTGGRILPFRLDVNRLDKTVDLGREKGLMEYSMFDGKTVYRKTGAAEFSDKKDDKRELANVEWVAFRNKYFAIIFDPAVAIESWRTQVIDSKRLDFSLDISDVENVQTEGVSANIFIGPQKPELLKAYEGANYDRLFVFFRSGVLDGVAKLMLALLEVTHKVLPNWGVTIIVMAILLNLMSYPLIMNQMKTARKMQALQPKITQLKDKYHNNPQKMQKEQMELFRRHKVNPLGGCLPLLIQMPIFIALYQVLWRSVFFDGADFLWIKDLSQPDRLFILPNYLPFIGNEINLLPIIMGVLMFFQQKLSKKNMPVTDPVQVSQQRMMMVLFPVMMLFFFYKAASGLTLYFVVLYVFMTVTQFNLSRMPKVEVL